MRQRILWSERGGVIFMVLLCGVLITVLGLTSFYMATTELTESSGKYEEAKALYLAEGGLERALVEMQVGMSNGWDDEVAGSDGNIGTDDDGVLSFGSQVDCFLHDQDRNMVGSPDGQGETDGDLGYWTGYLGHYDVRILDGRRPGESPGKCNRIIIQSEGVSTKNAKRQVEAEVELWELNLPQCLVYIDGTGVNVKIDGNAPHNILDGKDRIPDGEPGSGSGPAVPAILVQQWADAETIQDEMKSKQCDQILGVGNLYGDDPCTPSVMDLGSWNPNGFNPRKFVEKDLPKLETMVNNEIFGGTYAGHTTIGSETEYLITKCTGDLHISGQFDGFGVLIVDGALKISGKGRWDGIIIVKDEAEMCGGGQGYHLYGTVLVLNSSGGDHAEEFKFSGASSAAYSTSTIEKVQADVRTMSVNQWRQTASL